MKKLQKIILATFLILFSCKQDVILAEKKIASSNLIEPQEHIYIELLSYYPSMNNDQSNFYLVRNMNNKDTLLVVDKNNGLIPDFVKNYNGAENTTLMLERGKMEKKNEYAINIPLNFKITNKKLYLGELIKLVY